MGLVEELIQDALDVNVSISSLLRKAQVLAYRLGHEPLKEWVRFELGGYPEDSVVPEYRGPIGLDVRAHLSGPFQSEIRNMSVPLQALPEWARDRATKYVCRMGVAELADLVGREGSAPRLDLGLSAPGLDLVHGHTTMEIWANISRSALVGILDQVRNRLLTFALEIQKENPDAGEAAVGTQPIESERVAQIFNIITGGTHAWGVGESAKIQQLALSVSPGDEASLDSFLRNLGLESGDIVELREALAADEGVDLNGEPGHDTQSWIRKAGKKLASATGQMTTGVATGLLTEALKRFLGLG